MTLIQINEDHLIANILQEMVPTKQDLIRERAKDILDLDKVIMKVLQDVVSDSIGIIEDIEVIYQNGLQPL